MKWSLQQLKKIQKFPYDFSCELDFKEDIVDVEDIYDIDTVYVTGKIYYVREDTYRITYHIKASMILQCSLTLEPVDYLLEDDYEEIFSTDEDDDYNLIVNNTIDFRQVVWSNIIIDKPINVTRPDAYEILAKRGIILGEEPKLDASEMVISYSDSEKQKEEN